jgi:hypothetical protein
MRQQTQQVQQAQQTQQAQQAHIVTYHIFPVVRAGLGLLNELTEAIAMPGPSHAHAVAIPKKLPDGSKEAHLKRLLVYQFSSPCLSSDR